MVTSSAGATEAISLDSATLAPSSAAARSSIGVVDVAVGPQGLRQLVQTGASRALLREGGREVALPSQNAFSEPREQLLASGVAGDFLLLRTGSGVGVEVVGAGEPVLSNVLFEERVWTEASVAARSTTMSARRTGDDPRDPFLLVRTGPGIGDLEIYRVDARGSVARPVPAEPDPATPVRRHPRATALPDGWMVSFWDGTGPSILRVGSDGFARGRPMKLRSGDEHGGHTDTRMVATQTAIAATWMVTEPVFGHDLPEERRNRRGPRMAILRCEQRGPGHDSAR